MNQLDQLVAVYQRDGLQAALDLAEGWTAVEVAGVVTDYACKGMKETLFPGPANRLEAAAFSVACTWDARQRRRRLTQMLQGNPAPMRNEALKRMRASNRRTRPVRAQHNNPSNTGGTPE